LLPELAQTPARSCPWDNGFCHTQSDAWAKPTARKEKINVKTMNPIEPIRPIFFIFILLPQASSRRFGIGVREAINLEPPIQK
jgi:hypothetical protein